MRNKFKYLLFFLFIFCPFIIKASGLNYEDTIHYTNNYIYKFPKYNNYLVINDRIPFIYENGDFVYDGKYISGGLLSKTEFEISNKKNNTYLSNGLEYWTSTKSSASRHYVINYTLQEKLDSNKTGVRITEYVNNNIGISGRGSYSEPWQFSEIISLHVSTTNRLRGKVSTVACSNSSMKKETVTLTFTNGSDSEVYICPENGFKILSNSCSSYMTKDINDRYLVHNVKNDNLICNVAFTYITNKVTLNCDSCDSTSIPKVLYSSSSNYDMWFTDKNATVETRKITTLPSKKGYTYKGFYYNGILIIDSNGNIVNNVTSFITGDVTLNAKMEANTYQITLDAEHATSDYHTTSEYVVFDSNIPTIVVPQRVYTVNYNSNGGTISKTSDTVTYSFDGYYYNNVKYINGEGYSARKWDVDYNVTLTGNWSGGTLSLAIPTKNGHMFEGWSLNSDGSGTLYKGQQDIFNLISNGNTSVTLYAKWKKCGAGTYLSGNSCVTCAAGYYSEAGADSCIICQAGYYSTAGASSCNKCSAGKFSEAGSGSCSTCPAGSYCSGGTNKSSCPSGYTSDSGAKVQTDCYINVNEGKYIGTANSSTQTKCGSGTYKAAHKVNYGSTSSCLNCSAGTYSSEGSGSCLNCAAGTYSEVKASKCTTCPKGYQCPGGTDKVACTAGTYTNATGKTSCSTCAAGTYNSGTANTGCTTCEAGYYCSGGASKVACPTGYTSAAGATAQNKCYISVSAGKYLGTAKGTSQSNCAAGTYKDAHNVNYGSVSSCSDCVAGTYTNTIGKSSCTTCSAGTYNTGTGNTGCTICEKGYYCTGGTHRAACPSGTTSAAGATSSDSCEAEYKNEWVRGKSDEFTISKTKSNNWSKVEIKIGWYEEYNAYLNQSKITINKFQSMSSAAPGVMYVGGTNSQQRGIFINNVLVQRFNYTAGDTAFNYLNSLKNAFFDLNSGSTNPPYTSAAITHNNDGTLTVPIKVDLRILNISGSIYAEFENVVTNITLTDLR